MQDIINNIKKFKRTYDYVIPIVKRYDKKISKLQKERQDFIYSHLDRYFKFICPYCGREVSVQMLYVIDINKLKCNKCEKEFFTDTLSKTIENDIKLKLKEVFGDETELISWKIINRQQGENGLVNKINTSIKIKNYEREISVSLRYNSVTKQSIII